MTRAAGVSHGRNSKLKLMMYWPSPSQGYADSGHLFRRGPSRRLGWASWGADKAIESRLRVRAFLALPTVGWTSREGLGERGQEKSDPTLFQPLRSERHRLRYELVLHRASWQGKYRLKLSVPCEPHEDEQEALFRGSLCKARASAGLDDHNLRALQRSPAEIAPSG